MNGRLITEWSSNHLDLLAEEYYFQAAVLLSQYPLLDLQVLYGFLETYQTYGKKPLVWRNHTKAKGWKKPGPILIQVSYVTIITLCSHQIRQKSAAACLFHLHNPYNLSRFQHIIDKSSPSGEFVPFLRNFLRFGILQSTQMNQLWFLRGFFRYKPRNQTIG